MEKILNNLKTMIESSREKKTGFILLPSHDGLNVYEVSEENLRFFLHISLYTKQNNLTLPNESSEIIK